MQTRGLLDQLLKTGQDMLAKQGGLSGALGKLNQGKMNNQARKTSQTSDPLGGMLSSAGGGAMAASVLGMLLRNKRGRRMGGMGSMAKYGGLAALGMLAYQAYTNWQKSQANAPQSEPQTVDRAPEGKVEQHSQAILRALIAAAKADGHIDEQERQLIDAEMKTHAADDPELQSWLRQEINKPLDPAEIAAGAKTPEMAAEIYLASVLMADDQQFMEKAYLDELARHLNLDPGLRAELDSKAKGTSA
ncbi:uncharacterized membrane protein YebE (DUF533 family) [Pseudomonas duriflava]|uniref:Uncharacterized membrane protein YebE (DUF533 family) n=1 Tax=Pseudomonas duriflava TaxID=459528 RepID=A0A562QPU5_9PSED|nr:tellurite resistance TerB family protein [Pseudomonas duriflava]TWI58754.1 uncharacterized membrane protein YebE (DUF533 family) [Pseudomonas duriflava]